MKSLLALLCVVAAARGAALPGEQPAKEVAKATAGDNIKEWVQLTSAKLPSVETYAVALQRSSLPPQISGSFNISAELEDWKRAGNPSTLAFLVEGDKTEFGNIAPQQVALNTHASDSDYLRYVRFHQYDKYDPKRKEGDASPWRLPETTAVPPSWNPKRPLKVIIHGFAETVKSDFVQETKNAYMKSGENNVMVVDWSELARSPFYGLARVQVLPVAARVAKVVDLLVRSNLTEPALVHLIGYGLGGHVAGIAGKLATTGKIKRITGLDPAGPLFHLTDSNGRLYKTDAEVVDVIHTNGGFLGELNPVGSVDFYVDGGRSQHTCTNDFFGSCSSVRAYKLFVDSIEKKKEYEGLYCESLPKSFDTCLKEATRKATMGADLKFEQGGSYYVSTE